MLEALALAVLVWTGRVTTWQVMVLAVFFGVVNAFDIPARQAFIVELVGKEDLMNAIALNSSMFNAARIVGPAVAGVLIGVAGLGMCFFLNGVSYVAVIACLLAMRLPPFVRRPMPSSAWEGVRQAVAFIRGDARGWALVALVAVFVGMGPLGAFQAGLIAEHTGAPIAIALGGAGCLVAVALAAWQVPALRRTP